MLPEQREPAGGRGFFQTVRELGRGLAWQTVGRSSALTRLVMCPDPRRAPVNQARVLAARFGGVGDTLLCTPALRELKRRNPRCHVAFYTGSASLVRGLPYIDEVHDSSPETAPEGCIPLGYESFVPPHRHITQILGDRLGVKVTDPRPDCIIDAGLVDQFRREWSELPRPWVVINRHAGPWTPNKDWPDELWDDLIDRLVASGTVVETGHQAIDHRAYAGSYVDLSGRLKLAQFVAAIAAGDIHVGPISAGVHIAAAVRVPSVVIYGGYEHPVCTTYAGNVDLYSPVPCAPCWLRDPCPYAKKCLWQITPEHVEAAVKRLAKPVGRARAGAP